NSRHNCGSPSRALSCSSARSTSPIASGWASSVTQREKPSKSHTHDLEQHAEENAMSYQSTAVKEALATFRDARTGFGARRPSLEEFTARVNADANARLAEAVRTYRPMTVQEARQLAVLAVKEEYRALAADARRTGPRLYQDAYQAHAKEVERAYRLEI